MSKYLVLIRSTKSQAIHTAGSIEETVCEIAKNLLHFRGPADGLMAIPADTKVATFVVLKDEALCSIEVTDKTLATWRNDVTAIEDAINSFQIQVKTPSPKTGERDIGADIDLFID